MKLRILVLIALVMGAFFAVAERPVQAATTITPEVINRIESRCTENLAGLNRLHQTDAFIRNNRGNLYRTISDKLMVPLNRRLASNQLDGAALITITSNYNAEYNRFYRAYIDYDNALSEVLDIDCKREPVAFYNALLEAREKRIALSESNVKIKEFIRQYGTSFTEFKTKFEQDNK
ncbi:MAG: hypothetical protein V4678_04220 [Patescibacteria group bacterium]